MKNTLVIPDDEGYLVIVGDSDLKKWHNRGIEDGKQSKRDGLHNARGLSEEQSEPCNALGKIGEYVVAHVLGIEKSEDRSEDAGKYQVKTTFHEKGHLAVPPYHLQRTFDGGSVSNNQVYILVVQLSPYTFRIRGWATKQELLKAPLMDFGHPERPPMRALSQEELHSMETLPQ